MKKISFLQSSLALAVIASLVFSCQKTADRPAAINGSQGDASVTAINDSATLTTGESALLHGLGLPNGYNIDFRTINYNNFECFAANSWTYSGIQAPIRSLLKFGFTGLNPACTPATLVSAKLYLYQYVNASNGVPYSIAHVPNDFEIRRVLTPWVSSTVTFNTSPNTAGLPSAAGAKNAVAVPAIATPFNGLQDIQVVDVTEMVKKMLANGAPYSLNNGFMIRFPNGRETQAYKARFFGSFTAPNIADRPVLKLYWQ